MLKMVGERFGRLIVIEEIERRRTPNGKTERRFICKCDCGNTVNVPIHTLRNGTCKSCGCLRKETTSKNHKIHGKCKSKLYMVWRSMKDRCFREKSKQFKNYGGRGITVCDEWRNEYQSFEKWAIASGYREGLTIERIDNDKCYSPENCKWIPRSEQNKNRRTNHYLTYDGITKTLQEWADQIHINRCTLRAYCKKYGDENAVQKAIETKEG